MPEPVPGQQALNGNTGSKAFLCNRILLIRIMNSVDVLRFSLLIGAEFAEISYSVDSGLFNRLSVMLSADTQRAKVESVSCLAVP